jgi:hypothetical protein
LHTTARERYEKLKRVFSGLMKNFNRDDLDDFIQTANSMRESIQRNQTLTSEQRAAAEALTVPKSLDWHLYHQIANHQKHAGAKPRRRARSDASMPIVKAVRVVTGGTGCLPQCK